MSLEYITYSVYSLSQQDIDECITPINKDRHNRKCPAVQISCFSAVSDNETEDLVPFCVMPSLIPDNPTYSMWTDALAQIKPFSERIPVDVRIYMS